MPTYLPTLNWPIYSGWTNFTPTIPKLYWDVYSQEQRIKELCKNYSKCEQYLDIVAKLTNEWAATYSDEVAAKLDEFAKLLDFGSESTITKWIEKNLKFIFERTAKQVYFGLNKEGYFVAYVPDSWNDITFDTGSIYGRSDYGCLKLRFSADGAIDNRYSYNVSQLTSDDEFVNDFEALNNVVSQWATEIQNLDERVDALEG